MIIAILNLLYNFFFRFRGVFKVCIESNATAKYMYVNSCPVSAEDMTSANFRLIYGSIGKNCTSFVYHCVMDPNMTRMIEVCAPVTNILGSYFPLY